MPVGTGTYCIVDCFTDEPACLGVPPFIAPLPRYIYGTLIYCGTPPENIKYITIDSLRKNDYHLPEIFHAAFLTGGAIVPGKYLGTAIGTVPEIEKIIVTNDRQQFYAGGNLSALLRSPIQNLAISNEETDLLAFKIIKRTAAPSSLMEFRNATAPMGAPLPKSHPWFPDIICEIETYRGCPRQNHCSFCSEGLGGQTEFRTIEAILTEIDALVQEGVARFRLGSQPDILCYRSPLSSFKNGFPEPDPSPVIELFSELKARVHSGKILVLNVDNANPGTIFHFPEKSSRILEVIASSVTPGDTLALGFESFDENVVKQNNLKVTSPEALTVLDIVNSAGSTRIDGLPAILPGINLIHGLKGETQETFKINHQFLARCLERGLLVKRINIRKHLPFPGTSLSGTTRRISLKTKNRFEYYRDKIRKEIDIEMLKNIYPPGTLLKDVLVLDSGPHYSYGKQIMSYAITVKTPGRLKEGQYLDFMVTGHNERSLSALPVPLAINSLSVEALRTIPGISAKGASSIALSRPFKNMEELQKYIDSVPQDIAQFIEL